MKLSLPKILPKFKDSPESGNKNKKTQTQIQIIIVLSLILALGGIGGYYYYKSTKKITPKQLISLNFTKSDDKTAKIATIQELRVDINADENTSSKLNDLHLYLENKRDSDTDHMKINVTAPEKYAYEMYVTKVDLKYAVYTKLKDADIWNLTYRTKNISDDDARTDFTESNNEINLTDIKISSFEDISFDSSQENDFYVVKGMTTYNNMLAIIGNMRQALLENNTYNNKFFTQSGKNLKVNVIMKFNKTDNMLNSIIFDSDKNTLSSCKNNYTNIDSSVSEIKSFRYELTNRSYDVSDIYVPNDVDLNSRRNE